MYIYIYIFFFLHYFLFDNIIFCPFSGNCTHGDIKLIGGSTPMEGTVELCYQRTWGTVSDDYFGNLDASVVCRQLGYPGGKCQNESEKEYCMRKTIKYKI